MVKLSDIEYQAILDNEKRAVKELVRMRAALAQRDAEMAEAKAALSGHPLWIELAEARKDGERVSALQDGRLSTQYRDGATPSMDKWIVTFCATPIAGGSTLREAIDNATARGTR